MLSPSSPERSEVHAPAVEIELKPTSGFVFRWRRPKSCCVRSSTHCRHNDRATTATRSTRMCWMRICGGSFPQRVISAVMMAFVPHNISSPFHRAQGVPDTPTMGRVLCWSFISDIRGCFGASVVALGGEMHRIAAHFAEIGYRRASAKIYISRIGRFSAFAARNARSPAIDQAPIDRFLHSLRTAAARIAARTAIEHARRVAPERFSIPCRTMPDPWPTARRLSGSPAQSTRPGAQDL